MAMGKYPCVMPEVGIPYRRTLTEMNRRYWHLIRFGPDSWPPDSPLASLTWIIRGDGDPVDQLMRAFPAAFSEFSLVETYRFQGEDRVRVYRSDHQPLREAPHHD